jgi:phosphoglycerate dehydrogenase-like enzyme
MGNVSVEPPINGHVLFELDNVIVTPHIKTSIYHSRQLLLNEKLINESLATMLSSMFEDRALI